MANQEIENPALTALRQGYKNGTIPIRFIKSSEYIPSKKQQNGLAMLQERVNAGLSAIPSPDESCYDDFMRRLEGNDGSFEKRSNQTKVVVTSSRSINSLESEGSSLFVSV
eukprot:TRINITY_DN4572_c0_g1_i2.p1 TRINITY_DN4572_c0_g1~~TRINITY_DN4572_c0_g1_i2.p1  ORF type:complete len:121 (+),score=16.78 TRINITY_DN4572_c0_g1_i2:33-365(+)